MAHSFRAITGGIAIDPSDSSPSTPCSKRSSFIPKGASLLFIHKPRLLSDISEEEVKDNGNGALLTEIMACIQAT